MLFQGSCISVKLLDSDIAELQFDLQGESVNKFDTRTAAELEQALDALNHQAGLTGVLVTSGKEVFIVGADITEFVPLFEQSTEDLAGHLDKNVVNFNRVEDFKVPVVVAINGFALGGGLEFCLACDYRVASENARVGLPETQLGLIPGWGGCVRLPRLAGHDTALEWIISGRAQRAEIALAAGIVDEVVAPGELRESALRALRDCIAGNIDIAERRRQKTSVLLVDGDPAAAAFPASREAIAQQAGSHYPALLAAVDCIQQGARLQRDAAQELERQAFTAVFGTDAAVALVGVFISDQLIAKKARVWEKRGSRPVTRAAVLGAGIMGGGIAFQSAITGTPVKMKDIAQEGLDLGLSEARKLLAKRMARGSLTAEKMEQVLAVIEPTLSYDGFADVDIVVEAVVENPRVKHAVLKEVEQQVPATTILTSNTSTISITYLAETLQRPENFCGMHFFNPVHAMPLVEVIRGEKTSDESVARTMTFANALGKKAILVNDCPGFLVNRTLFPYLAGFSGLLRDGADFQQVDQVMEAWGWPMGPAYLLDVVGIDTCCHCEVVLAQGFPDRMAKNGKTGSDVMYENNRFGQKNGKGFYDYQTDEQGRPHKSASQQAYELLAPICGPAQDFDAEDIIARCMVPMATEMARCLEEGIVATPAEADMALVYGLAFPRFRGGILRWVDSIGMQKLAEYSDRYQDLGKIYQLTEAQRQMAAMGKRYY